MAMSTLKAFLVVLVSLIISDAVAHAAEPPAAPTFFCPAQQLRVARCERINNKDSDAAPTFVIEQMLVCQDKDKNFSLQARYLDESSSIKETAPIPATGTLLKDSSVYYTTNTGLNLVLSANRESAVIQQCLQVNVNADLKKNQKAGFACEEHLAVCK